MKKIETIPTIVGIIFLVAAVGAGLLLLRTQQTFKTGAAPAFTPKDVRVSNISDTSLTITWITDTPTNGFVKYSSNSSSFNESAKNTISEPSLTHFVKLENLSPSTDYFFKIVSEADEFDSNGSPWKASTSRALGASEVSVVIKGVVINPNGTKAPDAIVFAQLPDSTPLSSVTTSEGSWAINLSNALSTNLLSFAQIDTGQTPIEIFVSGTGTSATARIFPNAANPAPEIVLGQVHDFTNIITSPINLVPGSTLSLPPEKISTPESKIKIESPPPDTADSDVSTVTLESHDDGEVVTTLTPEFFGKGPAGTTITVTIQSNPITDTVTVGSNGNWQWEPPTGLEPGTHTITISWRDLSGILRTLTRTFEVQAEEAPAFESTPSASLVSPTASASPLSPSPATSPSPIPSSIATPVPIPESGILTPTLVLSIMGLGLVLAGLIMFFSLN